MFVSTVAAGISQQNSVFKTEEDAYKTLLVKFAEPSTKDAVNFKKYANVWNVISTTDIKNALNATDDNGDAVKFNGVEGKYVFVWDNCDLDAVVDVMVTLDVTSWNKVLGTDIVNAAGNKFSDNGLYTIEGVKAFLKAAYISNGTGSAATAAKAVADSYYLASAKWNYSTEQVAKCKNNEENN